MLRTTVGLAVLFATVAFDAQAQLRIVPEVGDVVRIESPTVKGRFTVESKDSDSMVLRSRVSSAAHTVPLQSITRMDIRGGQRSRGSGFLRGSGWGFLVGAVVGAGAGIASGDDADGTFFQMTAVEKAGILGVVLGGAGALVGGGVGAARPGHQWQRVHLQSVALTPRSSGGSVAASLSF